MNKNTFLPQQLIQLIAALFKDIFRQPAVLFWGIVFPILMSLGLGVAFTQKPDIFHTVAVIAKAEGTQNEGTPVMDAFLSTHAVPCGNNSDTLPCYKLTLQEEQLGRTTFTFLKTDHAQAMVLLKRGRVSILLEEKAQAFNFQFDPINPDSQLTYLKLARLLNQKKPSLADSGDLNGIQPLTVTGTRYIDFLVPGLMSMGIMMSCMWGLSYGMIEKRSKKLLRRMVATPMRKSYFLMALMIVRIAMNFIESGLLVLFAYMVFHIRIQGDIFALIVFFIAGNIAFGGIAIFVSARTANTEIGNGLINVVVMPMMVLSGVFFSYHNFPDWSLPYIQKLPLSVLADGIRSIFIEGAGFNQIAMPTLLLLSIGLGFFAAGLKFFKWH